MKYIGHHKQLNYVFIVFKIQYFIRFIRKYGAPE